MTVDAREAMLAAFEAPLGAESTRILGDLLPTQPWRTALPAKDLARPAVLEVMAARAPRVAELHEALVRLIGEEHAGTCMEYRVPAPWLELRRLGVPIPL